MKKYALICFLLLPATAAAFDSLATRHFVFLAPAAGQKAAAHLAQEADAEAESMAASLGLPAPAGTQVYVVESLEQFYRARPDAGRLPSWAAGAAWPEKNLMVLLLERGELDKTFVHELNHVLLGQAFRGAERVPRWLLEGLAMMWADEWSLQRLTTMSLAALARKTLPMDEIADSFPADLAAAEIAYCQSFYFIAFLKRQFGEQAFQRFFQEYTKHRDFKGALHLAYQLDWPAIEKLWLDYIGLHFSWLPLITSTTTLWFAAALLIIAGYIRKKRKGKQMLQAWEAEESCSRETWH